MAEQSKTEKDTVVRERSPSFPFIPLGTAVTRLEQFERKFGRHPAPVGKAGLAWNIKGGSSQANQTLSALKAFGFLAYKGVRDSRSAELTEDARILIRAQQEQIKKEIIKKAALKPKEIAKYWKDWQSDPPLKEIRLDALALKGGYTDDGAKTFLRVYDETIAFAGLSNSDKVTPLKDDGDDSGADSAFSVGDLVNWESEGQIQWEEPRKIIAVDEHEDGRQFFQVEGLGEYAGQIGWIPMEQATEAQPLVTPQQTDKIFTPPPPSAGVVSPETRKAVFPVSDGDVALIFPKDMTADGLDELGQYLEIFLKKERRTKE